MVVRRYVKQENMYKMNIKNSIKILFVSLAGILSIGQIFAQEQDSSVVNLGYGVTVTSEETSAAAGVATADDIRGDTDGGSSHHCNPGGAGARRGRSPA